MADWALVALAIASPVFSCGVFYGLLRGRLELVGFRLEQIEGVLGMGNHSEYRRRQYERS